MRYILAYLDSHYTRWAFESPQNNLMKYGYFKEGEEYSGYSAEQFRWLLRMLRTRLHLCGMLRQLFEKLLLTRLIYFIVFTGLHGSTVASLCMEIILVLLHRWTLFQIFCHNIVPLAVSGISINIWTSVYLNACIRTIVWKHFFVLIRKIWFNWT